MVVVSMLLLIQSFTITLIHSCQQYHVCERQYTSTATETSGDWAQTEMSSFHWARVYVPVEVPDSRNPWSGAHVCYHHSLSEPLCIRAGLEGVVDGLRVCLAAETAMQLLRAKHTWATSQSCHCSTTRNQARTCQTRPHPCLQKLLVLKGEQRIPD